MTIKTLRRPLAAALMLMVLLLAACSSRNTADASNPIAEHASPAEAFKAAGVNINLPEYLPAGYQLQSSITIDDAIAQITWEDAEGGQISLRASKPNGEDNQDITGDYNSYAYEAVKDASDIAVVVKGDSLDEIFQATWNEGNQKCALLLSVGVTEEEIVDIVNSMGNPE